MMDSDRRWRALLTAARRAPSRELTPLPPLRAAQWAERGLRRRALTTPAWTEWRDMGLAASLLAALALGAAWSMPALGETISSCYAALVALPSRLPKAPNLSPAIALPSPAVVLAALPDWSALRERFSAADPHPPHPSENMP